MAAVRSLHEQGLAVAASLSFFRAAAAAEYGPLVGRCFMLLLALQASAASRTGGAATREFVQPMQDYFFCCTFCTF